jgi:Fe-S cluster assembly protein SufB
MELQLSPGIYCVQRGLSQEEAVGLVVNGFVKDVLQQLPMEFAVEAQKLISILQKSSHASRYK